MFSDEYLDHWGAAYVAAHLRERGIFFQEFLADPRGYLKTVRLPCARLCVASGFRPLLPRQKRVAQTLQKRWALEPDGGGSATGEPDETRALVEAEDSNP